MGSAERTAKMMAKRQAEQIDQARREYNLSLLEHHSEECWMPLDMCEVCKEAYRLRRMT